eukprot:Lithocolla_globosa_v1_NODE_1147_length_2837_cov_11.622407.p2 type:complete len:141 gc:universal NODE_1147_length_2837_cov_11.622407:2400-1978(-)
MFSILSKLVNHFCLELISLASNFHTNCKFLSVETGIDSTSMDVRADLSKPPLALVMLVVLPLKIQLLESDISSIVGEGEGSRGVNLANSKQVGGFEVVTESQFSKSLTIVRSFNIRVDFNLKVLDKEDCCLVIKSISGKR